MSGIEKTSAFLSSEVALPFRDQLRAARYEVLRDSENVSALLFVFERLGSFLLGRMQTLGKYQDIIADLANHSFLKEPPDPAFHSSFKDLYLSVMQGRNDALHQGAVARHLAQHAVELALILEDAIMDNRKTASDYMVRTPVCAFPWQPFSFIRQTILANSFSYLPIEHPDGTWNLISDDSVARFLRFGESGVLLGKKQRDERLALTVELALAQKRFSLGSTPRKISERKNLPEAFGHPNDGRPVLVVRREGKKEILLGILTTFDVL